MDATEPLPIFSGAGRQYPRRGNQAPPAYSQSAADLRPGDQDPGADNWKLALDREEPGDDRGQLAADNGAVGPKAGWPWLLHKAL
jgi:hypothetical protein